MEDVKGKKVRPEVPGRLNFRFVAACGSGKNFKIDGVGLMTKPQRHIAIYAGQAPSPRSTTRYGYLHAIYPLNGFL